MKRLFLLLFLLSARAAYADTITRGLTETCFSSSPGCTVPNPSQIDIIFTVQAYVGPVWDSWHGTFMTGPAWEIVDLDGRYDGKVMTFSPTGIHGISWLPSSSPSSPPGAWIEFKVDGKQSYFNWDGSSTLLSNEGKRFGFRQFNPGAFGVAEPASLVLLALGLLGLVRQACR